MDWERLKIEFSHAGNENAIIACVLKDPSLFYEVEARISERDFLTTHNRAVWTIIRSLVRQDVKLDTTTIWTQAEALGLDTKVHGYEYVSALFEKEVDVSNLDFYLSRVADASNKLRVLRILSDLQEMVDKNKQLAPDTLPAASIVEAAQSRFMDLALETQNVADAANIGDTIDAFVEELQPDSPKSHGLSTSFSRLDFAINGLEPGTLTVVGARPKVGKSAILLNWTAHIAYQLGVPVLYLDTEMSTREQTLRLLSHLSGVPEKIIKRGEFRNDQQAVLRVEEAKEIVKKGFVAHKYFPDFSAESIGAIARKYYHQEGVRCVIFDYIKLSDDDLDRLRNVKEHQSLGYLCSSLKKVAGELDIPVLTAAQIGREGANKGRITASHFADSDRILRYANTLLGLSTKTREEMTEAEEKFGRQVAMRMGTHRLQILATRAGGENFGGIDVHFRKEILTMCEALEQEADHLKGQGGDGDEDTL